ncbi:hypothetical protein [Microvirga aerophila]|uniref:Uncharacterized protein n=1 Tax=Microvirga aerophila TaxID=670291 RepID=A0A512BNR8_9HYPH|nr:hypothetical protein [Microvirga aerophila]GEO13527.1 hypothetical protein MAE02_12230 [Microvirga aerophila]
MTWTRGFFRLWVALSLIWGVYVFAQFSTINLNNTRNWLIVSEFCTQHTRQGEEILMAYELEEILETGRQEKYPQAIRVSVPNVIACERDNRFRSNLRIAWDTGTELVGALFLPPLVLLGVGMICGWVLSGFRAKRTA